YVLKPFEPDLLRSKVAVFAELEASRRALKRSEALLRGAFEAAPIGKTLLDADWRIIRANPAFARLVGWSLAELQDTPVTDLCQSEDLEILTATLQRAAEEYPGGAEPPREVDLRIRARLGSELWVGIVASRVEPSELGEPLLMVQWVDLTTRRRAERARAELLLEQAARAQAEAMANRLGRLQELSSALESLSLEQLLPELALRLASMHAVPTAEVEIGDGPEAIVFRAHDDEIAQLRPGEQPERAGRWEVAPVQTERTRLGSIRLEL